MNDEMITTLNKILPVVDRVHGDNHPELHQVLSLYNEIKEAPSAELFNKLREITADYSVPADVCQTYEKTYQLLKALDMEYSC